METNKEMEDKTNLPVAGDAETGAPQPTEGPPTPQPAPDPKHDPSPSPAPPAAKIVMEGQRSERELQLETELDQVKRELAEERTKRASTEEDKKQREIRVAELEDRLSQLLKPSTSTSTKREKPQRRRLTLFRMNE